MTERRHETSTLVHPAPNGLRSDVELHDDIAAMCNALGRTISRDRELSGVFVVTGDGQLRDKDQHIVGACRVGQVAWTHGSMNDAFADIAWQMQLGLSWRDRLRFAVKLLTPRNWGL